MNARGAYSVRHSPRGIVMKISIGLLLLPFAQLALGNATVLFEQNVVELTETLADPTDLWVVAEDLTRVNGFELKPEGACLDEICVPVKQDEDSDMFVRRNGKAWFNVSELADRLQQPEVVDYDAGVFSFGAIPVTRSAFLEQAVAPNFELTDQNGATVQLSDFKGKKIMLLTWASW